MVDRKAIEKVYKQNLEESIITYLAEEKKMDFSEAMDVYYKSKLAVQIQQSECGIENMDYKYLVNDLIVNEPELFDKKQKESSCLTESLEGILCSNHGLDQSKRERLREKYEITD